jgi:outer membrane protein assembly factor BamB
VLELDAETGDVRNTIPLPERQPGGITTGLGAVWVTTEAGLVKIDADSASVVGTFSSARGSLVTTAGGNVWVAGSSDVVGLNPGTGKEVAKVPFKDPCMLTSSTDAVYIASCMGASRSHDELVGVDASSGSVLFATRRDGWGPMDVVDGTIIVAQHDPLLNGDAIALVSFDAQTGHQLGQPFVVQREKLKPEAMLPLSVTPMMMAADQGSVWVTDFTAEQVIRVDFPFAEGQAIRQSPTPPPSSPQPEG